MKKLKKEDIYINLQGKSKDELTELYWLLKNNNEKLYRDSLYLFLKYPSEYKLLTFDTRSWSGFDDYMIRNKQEVTIQQLKEILQPMETKSKPIAIKCTQEQFEAIKPKLIKGGITIFYLESDGDMYVFKENHYINSFSFASCKNYISKYYTIHEEWNEEVFLKSCGIKVDTLEQQLEKAKAEVKRIEDEIEESKIKIGDWVISKLNDCVFRYQYGRLEYDLTKITDQELINKLDKLIK